MKVTQERKPGSQITKIVLEQIFPSRTFEIEPYEFVNHMGKFGGLSVDGHSVRLVGVRIEGHEDIVSYADWYWFCNPDHSVNRARIYVGVSRGAGLNIS